MDHGEIVMRLPLWVFADAIVVEMGDPLQFVTHKSIDGKRVFPVFLDESEATNFLKRVPMPGQCPVGIADVKYLVGMFEFLQREGLEEVHLYVPVPAGFDRCEIAVGDFIKTLRDHL